MQAPSEKALSCLQKLRPLGGKGFRSSRLLKVSYIDTAKFLRAVRFGSLADIREPIRDVRLLLKADVPIVGSQCPLSANSGHSGRKPLRPRFGPLLMELFDLRAGIR
jgi:hypothetical protein